MRVQQNVMIVLIVVAITLLSSSLMANDNQGVVTFNGYTTLSLNSDSLGESVTIEKFRLQPKYVNGKWSVRMEIAPDAAIIAKYVYVKYETSYAGWNIDLLGGRIATPFVKVHMSPSNYPFVRYAFDKVISRPFFDQGAGVIINRGFSKTYIAVTSGSGKYVDDNGDMDFSGRLTLSTKYGKLSTTYQNGMQPEGMRELVMYDYSHTLGPVDIQLIRLLRPRIGANGYSGSAVVNVDSLAFVVQYERSDTKEGSYRLLDLGVNLATSGNATLKAHTLLNNRAKPEHTLQCTILF